jgi:hypothetical protein
MAWTQTDIDTLKTALADGKGARVIQFSDQRVEFHSIPDMLDLLSRMEREVNTSTIQRHRYASVSKGT